MTDFRDIREALRARAESLCHTLLPAGKGEGRRGNYWIVRNPSRADARAGSFYVWLKGPAVGGYKDEASGDSGDVIDLICLVRGCNRKEARDWALAWLGWSDAPPEQIRRDTAKAEKLARDRALADARELEAARRNATAMWLNAAKLKSGDPADLYLRGRGIELEGSGVPANAIRFTPSMRHLESGRYFACIVSMMSGPDGQHMAVHRIWLAPKDGAWLKISDARGVKPPRKIWPSYAGAVIRIHKGESRFSPEQAEKKGVSGPVVICEGVEDGLACAIARPDLRVWSAGSLGNLANVPALACVSEFIVCQDNDWNKPQALKQFEAAVLTLAAKGRPVRVARSWIGKDANDLLKGETA